MCLCSRVRLMNTRSHPLARIAPQNTSSASRPGPDPAVLQAELDRIRQGLPAPVSLAEFRRRQQEHDAQCEALFSLHLVQMKAARTEAARLEPWAERLAQAVLWRCLRARIERVAWNRACLALHHWAWLSRETPDASTASLALLSARRALAGAPERAQRALERPLAQALLCVAQAR